MHSFIHFIRCSANIAKEVATGDFSRTESLLEEKADPNAKSDDVDSLTTPRNIYGQYQSQGKTALHFAATYDNKETLKRLIAAKADKLDLRTS